MQALAGLPVLILGLGASGLAMARWCARQGAQVTVADTRAEPPQRATLVAELPAVNFVPGPFSAALVEGTPVRAVLLSPGLSPAAVAPVVGAARSICASRRTETSPSATYQRTSVPETTAPPATVTPSQKTWIPAAKSTTWNSAIATVSG